MRSLRKWYADLAPPQKLGARLLALALILFGVDSALGLRLGIYGVIFGLGSAVLGTGFGLVGLPLLVWGGIPASSPRARDRLRF
jgi:hypothetical protein